MPRAALLSTLLSLSALGLACGDSGLGLDPSKPANELTDEQYRTLCDEAFSPLRDEEFVDDTCVYASIDIGGDQERCEESLETCRSIGGLRNADDIDALCSSPRGMAQFDCVATVGQYLDCIESYNAVLADFLAGFTCANSDPPSPPIPSDVPACEPLVSVCGEVFFLY